MIGVIIDLIQSFSIIILGIVVILIARRVNKLQERLSIWPIVPKQFKTAERGIEIEMRSEPKPICGCEHHQCFHDEDGCGYIRTWQSALNHGDDYESRCGCKRYTGPEPLPQVIP